MRRGDIFFSLSPDRRASLLRACLWFHVAGACGVLVCSSVPCYSLVLTRVLSRCLRGRLHHSVATARVISFSFARPPPASSFRFACFLPYRAALSLRSFAFVLPAVRVFIPCLVAWCSVRGGSPWLGVDLRACLPLAMAGRGGSLCPRLLRLVRGRLVVARCSSLLAWRRAWRRAWRACVSLSPDTHFAPSSRVGRRGDFLSCLVGFSRSSVSR